MSIFQEVVDVNTGLMSWINEFRMKTQIDHRIAVIPFKIVRRFFEGTWKDSSFRGQSWPPLPQRSDPKPFPQGSHRHKTAREISPLFDPHPNCRQILVQGWPPPRLGTFCAGPSPVTNSILFCWFFKISVKRRVTVCFLDKWPKTECKVSFDTSVWSRFLCSFMW